MVCYVFRYGGREGALRSGEKAFIMDYVNSHEVLRFQSLMQALGEKYADERPREKTVRQFVENAKKRGKAGCL